jgi:aminoglycoside phosphotransferase (APT) family kinase protein
VTSRIESRPTGQPAAEVEVTPALVRQLLRQQHPDLADEPLRLVGAGCDNTIFRLGDQLSVRLPRRAAAERLLIHEQMWLPSLAPRLPLRVPAPVRLGSSSSAFPWVWSVVPWIPGTPAHDGSPDFAQVETLVAFFDALHVPAPPDAPISAYRGVPLADRKEIVDDRMPRLEEHLGDLLPLIRPVLARAYDAPVDVPSTWLHGDLHALNVLTENGAISGIIDWGDLCQGDRATDLAAIWMLLADQRARERAMKLCTNVSDATWDRARGWALFFGIVLSDIGRAGDARYALMGERTLRRIAEGP